MPTSSDLSTEGRPGATGPAGDPDRHRTELLRYVERFALALTDVGLPRMPARVFAYVLCDDAERYTAAELATALQVSPAAISGAVRRLTQMRLLGKEREPGSRVDTYRVYDDDLWGMITTQRAQMVTPFEHLADEGVALLGPETPGGRRLRETSEYFRFFRERLAQYTVEWRARKAELFGPGQ
ncbi:MarR family transcriptional regulator [Natronosporangium hydrolyticum]|uniref:MarR family transcriptional regulator n=1 Tax=Natronosporangium hydrolyticum TaxID=2811111 RepID=A0A895YGK7_9ACTN|nr:helix-turn-helix domain-containing protein [Natronosporangium hydrolyticum]QSB15205.1 MarR family transcriptional regulator [Natronosporangium hydrolyticum]